MTRSAHALILVFALAAVSCGGPKEEAAPRRPADSGAPAPAPAENRWLRGLWADDIRVAMGNVAMKCTGPALENRQSVWSCESATPLVSYKARFYGTAPGKIEYITATVAQSDRPRDEIPLRIFLALAGLHFEGADPQKARAWVRQNLAAGGATEFGSAKFKLAGDARRRQLDIKASGSEW